MKSLDALTEPLNMVSVPAQPQETLPYDIRAEIDWIDFSCVANPLGTPQCIKSAITSAINEGDLSFVPNSDGQHLSHIIARYFEIPADSILAGTSVSSMISAVAQAYRPCNVGIPTPAPTGYFLSVANVGHNPVKLVNPYSLSAIEPHSAFSNGQQFDAAILANPSYPCARLLSEKTLKHYLDSCNWVIVDESNISLTLGGESFVELTQKYPNLFVIRNLSNELGMPGIPMGYVCGNASAIEHIKQFSDGSELSMFNEIVAREFPHTDEYHEETVSLLEKEIPWMQCMLSLTPGIKVFPSEANFVMCALKERSARDLGISNVSDLIVRLQKAGYTVRDLTGVPGIDNKRYFLVSIRSHADNEKFICALRDIIAGA